MKSLKKNFLIHKLLFLLILLLPSCKPTKYLTKNQYLIEKVEVKGIQKREIKDNVHNIVPKANTKYAGIKLPLHIYNLINVKDNQYKEKTKAIGQPPAIYDSIKIVQTTKRINKYLFNKGYFNAKTTYKVDTLKKQNVKITFLVTLNERYFINDYTSEIEDIALERLYKYNHNPVISTNQPYDYYKLEEEMSSTTTLFKNNGYKSFEKSYIKYSADTLINESIPDSLNKNLVDVTILITNPDKKVRHQTYTINNTNITVYPNKKEADTLNLDTITAQNGDIRYLDKTGRYNLKPIKNQLFIKKGSKYSQQDYINTYSRLSDLNLFKFITINYTPSEEDSTKLDVNIELIPMAKRSISNEGELTLSGSYWGINGKISYSNKNLFNNGEILDIQLGGGLDFQPEEFNGAIQDRIREKTLNASTSITFPELIGPFEVNNVYSLPKTKVTLGYSYEEQSQFKTGETYTNFTYDWYQTKEKNHYLTPISIRVANSVLDSALQHEYESTGNLSALERYSSYISIGAEYTFTYNDYRLKYGGDFWYLKSSISMAGNILAGGYKLAKNPNVNDRGQYTIAGLPFYQYTQPEIDVRYYKKLGHTQLVARLNVGAGISYGNSTTMPYSSLYGSSSNTNRAWRSQQVGPGAFPRNDIHANSDFEQTQLQLDQLGEFKIETNIEYRFPITNQYSRIKLNGAVFVDAGNVWNLNATFNELYPGGEFKPSTFFKELAIGTGFGLRLDLDFLVLRFDTGIKLHDPQFEDDNNKWVIKHIGNKEFKSTYPDYRFASYSIGIGYPF